MTLICKITVFENYSIKSRLGTVLYISGEPCQIVPFTFKGGKLQKATPAKNQIQFLGSENKV